MRNKLTAKIVLAARQFDAILAGDGSSHDEQMMSR
jgi:hypothetical protein